MTHNGGASGGHNALRRPGGPDLGPTSEISDRLSKLTGWPHIHDTPLRAAPEA